MDVASAPAVANLFKLKSPGVWSGTTAVATTAHRDVGRFIRDVGTRNVELVRTFRLEGHLNVVVCRRRHARLADNLPFSRDEVTAGFAGVTRDGTVRRRVGAGRWARPPVAMGVDNGGYGGEG